jgi:PKHD-type hydroxylase
MNLKWHYWQFPAVLSSEICNKIIKEGQEKPYERGVTGKYESKSKKTKKLTTKDTKDLKKIRDCQVKWLDEKWIYDLIRPFVQTANLNAEWNFEFNQMEECQLTRYKKNHFYEWHRDDNTMNKKGRKLTFMAMLSEEKDYKGGHLEFAYLLDKPQYMAIETVKTPRGTVIIFPSFVFHRLKPITKGIRYSLVCWNIGAPWK